MKPVDCNLIPVAKQYEYEYMCYLIVLNMCYSIVLFILFTFHIFIFNGSIGTFGGFLRGKQTWRHCDQIHSALKNEFKLWNTKLGTQGQEGKSFYLLHQLLKPSSMGLLCQRLTILMHSFGLLYFILYSPIQNSATFV